MSCHVTRTINREPLRFVLVTGSEDITLGFLSKLNFSFNVLCVCVCVCVCVVCAHICVCLQTYSNTGFDHLIRALVILSGHL